VSGCEIRGRGVHHYYVQTLWGYVKKRRRAIAHFFRVRDQTPVNWMKEKPPVPIGWQAFIVSPLSGRSGMRSVD